MQSHQNPLLDFEKLSDQSTEKLEGIPKFKIVLLGNSGVGKSSLINRFVKNSFSPEFKATIGVGYEHKRVVIENRVVELHILDTAGQERYSSIAKSFLRDANGFLIVYDITRPYSFSDVDKWLDMAQENTARDHVPIVLVGNKTDLAGSRQVQLQKARALAETRSIRLVETSAKSESGDSVDRAFYVIVKQIIRCQGLFQKFSRVPLSSRVTENMRSYCY